MNSNKLERKKKLAEPSGGPQPMKSKMELPLDKLPKAGIFTIRL
jgi:hypothetical protein